MKASTLRAAKYLAPAALFAIILVVATLSLRQPAVSASPPPPDVPDFAGEITYETLVVNDELSREIVNVNALLEEWVTIFEDDFEDEDWEQQWDNISRGGDYYKYDTRTVKNDLDPFSTKVAWAVGKNPDGEPALDPTMDGYPPNVNAWLIAGPFDFSNVATINLAFEYSFEADVGDTLAVHASTNLTDFEGPEKDGGDGDWIPADIDLSSYAGEPNVWIAFIFKSDNSPNTTNKLGLFLDNVKLDVRAASKAHLPYISYDVTPTPNMTPTPTVSPGEDYYKAFTNNIDGWDEVRWSNGADTELRHSDSCDGNDCGFLNLTVQKSDHYSIVSPEVNSKPVPYTMETSAKIRSDRDDLDSYGIVFGASTNGQSCPGDNFANCFEHYYELRVRYRNDGNDSWLEFKLVSVGGHDGNNQPIATDLIGWTKVSQDPDLLAEWDVDYETNGDITVKVSDDVVGSANDSKFINNPFFGLVVHSGPNGQSEVKFDYFQVK